ncbi:MAG: ABC transporter permease [Pseudomonadota bacterium]|nr:ABC transporter permease [Pseudomonadota bacterium]
MPSNLKFGFLIFAPIILLSLLSTVWTPYDITVLRIEDKLKPIFDSNFLLGTDHFGRDILSMLMIGSQTSVLVASIAIIIGISIGVPLGLIAASQSDSLMDEAIMRTNDLIFAFPALVIAILFSAILGPSPINAIIAIGVFNIPVFARVTRGAALSIFKLDYVLSARTCGKGVIRICIEHILPNITSVLLVQSTTQFSLGILAEAGLSYVGLGAQPPIPSWGRMLSDSQTMVSFAPHLALAPGLLIIVTVVSVNLMGDGLRDYLDPKTDFVPK